MNFDMVIFRQLRIVQLHLFILWNETVKPETSCIMELVYFCAGFLYFLPSTFSCCFHVFGILEEPALELDRPDSFLIASGSVSSLRFLGQNSILRK